MARRGRRAKIAEGCYFGRSVSRELAVGFAGVEVGGGMEPVFFAVIFQDPSKAPNERAASKADGENEKNPSVGAHGDFLSRAFQTRTARAISKRKSAVTATTKRRAIRTEWEV